MNAVRKCNFNIPINFPALLSSNGSFWLECGGEDILKGSNGRYTELECSVKTNLRSKKINFSKPLSV